MTMQRFTDIAILLPERWLGQLESVTLFAIRLWVGWDFFTSGLLKLSSWQGTLFLFREEYHVPLLPSNVAAVLGTGGELAFPILLWLGLAGRLGALGLSAVNAMAVIAYAHVLLGEGFEAALGQHYLWGMGLIVIAVFGPGRVSADYLLTSYRPRRDSASMSLA